MQRMWTTVAFEFSLWQKRKIYKIVFLTFEQKIDKYERSKIEPYIIIATHVDHSGLCF